MDNHSQIITKSATETEEIGRGIAKIITPLFSQNLPICICLYGELGSGKTTFVRGLANGLGITSRITSPTFIIMKQYTIPSFQKSLYHFDLYRLSKETKSDISAILEIMNDSAAVIVIEWPEIISSILPKSRIDITFYANSDESHIINIQELFTVNNKL